MFHFIPVTGAKQKLGEEKILENWMLVSTILKLNAITTICLNYLVIFKHFNNAIKTTLFCIQIIYIFIIVVLLYFCISSQFLVK